MIDNNFCIEFRVDNPKLISVNEQYIHPVRKSKSGRYYSYFAPSPYLKEVKKYYKDLLSKTISDNDVIKVNNFFYGDIPGRGICLQMIVGLPENEFYKHDISNYIKAVEDCISERLGVDDSKNTAVSIQKMISHGWFLDVKINSADQPFVV